MLFYIATEERFVVEIQFAGNLLDAQCGVSQPLGDDIGRIAVDHPQRCLATRLAHHHREVFRRDAHLVGEIGHVAHLAPTRPEQLLDAQQALTEKQIHAKTIVF